MNSLEKSGAEVGDTVICIQSSLYKYSAGKKYKVVTGSVNGLAIDVNGIKFTGVCGVWEVVNNHTGTCIILDRDGVEISRKPCTYKTDTVVTDVRIDE